MDKRLVLLVGMQLLLATACFYFPTVVMFGLSTTVLGSSSMLLGSVSSSSSSAISLAYSKALSSVQLYVSLASIGILAYLELSNPAYGKTRRILEELRKGWVPVSVLFVILFFILVFFKAYLVVYP